MNKKAIDRLTGFCVITGASSGIGLELTKLAAKDGVALLLVADRDLSEAESAAKAMGPRRSRRSKPISARGTVSKSSSKRSGSAR